MPAPAPTVATTLPTSATTRAPCDGCGRRVGGRGTAPGARGALFGCGWSAGGAISRSLSLSFSVDDGVGSLEEPQTGLGLRAVGAATGRVRVHPARRWGERRSSAEVDQPVADAGAAA